MLAMLSIMLIIVQNLFEKQLQKLGLIQGENKIQVDEDLPNFFKSIKMTQAREIVCENQNMKDRFGFEIQDPDTIEGLDRIVMPFKSMQGTPWY